MRRGMCTAHTAAMSKARILRGVLMRARYARLCAGLCALCPLMCLITRGMRRCNYTGQGQQPDRQECRTIPRSGLKAEGLYNQCPA